MKGTFAMEFKEGIKFVNNWLWDCTKYGSVRITTQMPWSNPYIKDAAQMVCDAVNDRKIPDTLESPDSSAGNLSNCKTRKN